MLINIFYILGFMLSTGDKGLNKNRQKVLPLYLLILRERRTLMKKKHRVVSPEEICSHAEPLECRTDGSAGCAVTSVFYCSGTWLTLEPLIWLCLVREQIR